MLPCAIVLLGVLATFAPAAPAPLARRDRDTAEQRSWGKPVAGLRARLVAPKGRYRLGDTVRLVLEIQNVSGGTLAIDEPHLSRYISSPGYEPHGWSISGERVADRDGLMRKQSKSIQESLELRRSGDRPSLAAGQVIRVEIEVSTSRGEKQGEAKEREREADEPRRAEMHFDDADSPGVFQFRAMFNNVRGEQDESLEKQRAGERSLTTPPVRIELKE